jgi:hypothetical protein
MDAMITKCPRCQQGAFSTWTKLCLGPLRRVPCNQCGAKLSVAWVPSTLLILLSSFVATLGGFIAMTLISNPGNLGLLLALFIAGAVGSATPFLWVYANFVPLVARDA